MLDLPRAHNVLVLVLLAVERTIVLGTVLLGPAIPGWFHIPRARGRCVRVCNRS